MARVPAGRRLRSRDLFCRTTPVSYTGNCSTVSTIQSVHTLTLSRDQRTRHRHGWRQGSHRVIYDRRQRIPGCWNHAVAQNQHDSPCSTPLQCWECAKGNRRPTRTLAQSITGPRDPFKRFSKRRSITWCTCNKEAPECLTTRTSRRLPNHGESAHRPRIGFLSLPKRQARPRVQLPVGSPQSPFTAGTTTERACPSNATGKRPQTRIRNVTEARKSETLFSLPDSSGKEDRSSFSQKTPTGDEATVAMPQ